VALLADQVAVRHLEGRIHGFLVLRDAQGAILASGVLTQNAAGNTVTNDLVFHFKDGSLHQETTVFSQRRVFRLQKYHLVQKGKAFKRATDLNLNLSTGRVDIKYSEEDGQEKAISEQMKLPPDLANGIVPTLVGDIDPHREKTVLSMLVSTPKPRIVKLEVIPSAEDSFQVDGRQGKALRYVVKIDLGGVAGVIAPVIGKQPPDTILWIAGGTAPGFLRSAGPLFEDGPIWTIELAAPVWKQ